MHDRVAWEVVARIRIKQPARCNTPPATPTPPDTARGHITPKSSIKNAISTGSNYSSISVSSSHINLASTSTNSSAVGDHITLPISSHSTTGLPINRAGYSSLKIGSPSHSSPGCSMRLSASGRSNTPPNSFTGLNSNSNFQPGSALNGLSMMCPFSAAAVAEP